VSLGAAADVLGHSRSGWRTDPPACTPGVNALVVRPGGLDSQVRSSPVDDLERKRWRKKALATDG